MDPSESRFVHKYYEPADRFLRVRICDPVHPGFRPGEGLDGAGYRRLVVRSCVDGMEDLDRGIASLGGPEEDSEALDRLYELVLAVNPTLDIHAVCLADTDRVTPSAPTPAPRRDTSARRLRRRVAGLETRLARRVVGQEKAVASVARILRRAAAGLGEERGPLARLLFVGPTGTGKTELSRALAQELGVGPPVRIDCGEYAEGHEYSKLIGAPPGYVGHEEGGILTEALALRPDSVVVFDEVEKAHPRLHHLLLGLLEEGELTDGRGITVDFRRAIVLCTSNTGARQLARAAESLGFGGPHAVSAGAAEEIGRRALGEAFRPEFLARLDEVLHFAELNEASLTRIAALRLQELAVRVRRRQRRLRCTPAVARWVARAGARGREGARGISHVIRREIEAPLAELVLGANATSGRWIHVSIRGGRPRLAIED